MLASIAVQPDAIQNADERNRHYDDEGGRKGVTGRNCDGFTDTPGDGPQRDAKAHGELEYR